MASVWINPGCIQCGWCQNLEPRVFTVTEQGCHILDSSRVDQSTDDNRDRRSPLRAEVLDAESLAFLPFIASGCPVQVIEHHGLPSLEEELQQQEG